MSRIPAIVTAIILGLSAHPLCARELYQTDFDNFTPGLDQWAGSDGWVNGNAQGVNGIDENIIPGFDKKTAFLGFNQPSNTLVSVVRPFNYDHVAGKTPVIEIECLMGIQDSTNNRRDTFLLSIFNSNGVRIAGLRFNNTESPQFGIWRMDGNPTPIDTGDEFIRNSLHLLLMQIDLINNTWTASLDGIPLFSDTVFNATGQPVNFGSFAFQWDLTAFGTLGYGNNWLLISDFSVNAIPTGESPITIAVSDTVPPAIEWLGEFGFDYQLEVSENLLTWTNTIPNSFINGLSNAIPLSVTDVNANTLPANQPRYYRVRRKVTR